MSQVIDVIRLLIQTTITKVVAGFSITPQIDFGIDATMANGTGAGQSDISYQDRLTIVNSGTPQTLDLSGSLKTPLGDPAVFVKVTTLAMINRSTASTYTVSGNFLSSSGMLAGTSPSIKIGPGGMFLEHRQDATAFPVTNSTGDALSIATDTGSNVDVDVLVAGRSA